MSKRKSGGLARELPIEMLERKPSKYGTREQIEQKVEDVLRNEKKAYPKMWMMVKHFGADEDDINRPFKYWKDRDAVVLYATLTKYLDKMVRSGQIRKKKERKAWYYWWAEKPEQTGPSSTINEEERKERTSAPTTQVSLPTDEQIVNFVREQPLTEMQIAAHFGIPKRGGARTRLWNQLRSLVEEGYLDHDYSGVKNQPYVFVKSR